MKKGLTELVFLLDRSGSMGGLEADTIGGFNAMMEKQKKEDGEVLVTTYLFDNVSEMLHDRVRLQDLHPMTDREYFVRGSTALLDAIGSAIRHIDGIHRYIRAQDVPEHTLFVITTDGMENASHSYSRRQIRQLIERRKRSGWEFLFLGANIDAAETAVSYGIDADCAADYFCDGAGIQNNFAAVGSAIHTVRSSQPLTASWKACLDEDQRRRADTRKP